MFHSIDAEREYQAAMAQEHMSEGEYMNAALRQYAGAYGAEDADRAWISTPFDTWERNPHYVGLAMPHPEEDVYDLDEWRAFQCRPACARICPTPHSEEAEDEIPF